MLWNDAITAGIYDRRNGVQRHFAWQQCLGPNVRFGSKADIEARPINVRFTPNSGHCAPFWVRRELL